MLFCVIGILHIIFVVTGAPMSRRANGVYAKIGVHLLKGWVLLQAVGNTEFYADDGNFLKQMHRTDLDTAMKEFTMCANTRIPIFSLLHALPE